MTTNSQALDAFLVSQGLSQAGAAGVVGNTMAESNVNPTAGNTGSGPYGIAQWLGSRLTALKVFAFKDNASMGTLAEQEKFLTSEMQTSYPALWSSLKTATDPQAAALDVMNQYERPGDNSGPRRAAFALQAYQAGGNVPGSSSSNQGAVNVGLQTDPLTSAIQNVPGDITGAVQSGLSSAFSGLQPTLIKLAFVGVALGLAGAGLWKATSGPRAQATQTAAKLAPLAVL